MRDLAKATLAKKLASLAHSTQVTYCRHLKREEQKLGALTVREIEASDVVALAESAGLTWGVAGLGLARYLMPPQPVKLNTTLTGPLP